MIRIHPAQLTALSQEEERAFKGRLIRHLQSFFPARCRELGELEVQRMIDDSISGAARYHLSRERDVCFYVTIRFILGDDFEQQPQLSWIVDMLSGPASTASARVESLFRIFVRPEA